MEPSVYDMHDAQEATHWWFVARRRIVADVLARHLAGARPGASGGASRGSSDTSSGASGAGGASGGASDTSGAWGGSGGASGLRILDLGCGTGGSLPMLAEFGRAVGVEPSPEAAELARRKTGAEVRVGSLPDAIPFDDESFHVVTMLDVLEHVEDDGAALHRVAELLRPGGLYVCTVPAFMSLWSSHDVLNRHFRRYRREQLRGRLEGAGFEVLSLSYFNTILFPPIALARRLDRWLGGGSEPRVGVVPRPVNAILAAVFGSERWLLRWGSLPVGVSLLAVARKTGKIDSNRYH